MNGKPAETGFRYRPGYGGILIAGGGSTRMGTDKRLLPLGETTSLERMAAFLAAQCRGVWVAAGSHELPPVLAGSRWKEVRLAMSFYGDAAGQADPDSGPVELADAQASGLPEAEPAWLAGESSGDERCPEAVPNGMNSAGGLTGGEAHAPGLVRPADAQAAGGRLPARGRRPPRCTPSRTSRPASARSAAWAPGCGIPRTG
ncbi:nucleotidyltransferase family protein [Paenibacillus sp. CC-CFT747]|nr:nucleotidyltransferase family protein [Paenibacillus sp. CC-CFT747]